MTRKNRTASNLAKLRWSKEKPDPEYFKKIRAIGVKKQKKRRKEKPTDSPVSEMWYTGITIFNNSSDF